jgi:hypothetical protein
MSDVQQRLGDLLRARAEQVAVTVDLDDVKRIDSVDLVLVDPLGANADGGAQPIERAARPTQRRSWTWSAAAAIVLVLGIALLTVPGRGDRDDALEPAASISMRFPSDDEQAQAVDVGVFMDDTVVQVSPAGHSVSLRRCRQQAAAGCGSGWAYVIRLAGSEQVSGGLLGEADPENLHLQLLDDRYFVAWEAHAAGQAPVTAWLIDASSGGVGRLTWRDEPTVVTSPDQRLLMCEESVTSFSMNCTSVRGPDAPDGGWQFIPASISMPSVVDVAAGTIQPLSLPDTAVSGLPVAQHGDGRIWVGTNPEGDRLGLAYSDDGGVTWIDAELPRALDATSTELEVTTPYGDDYLELAADGDRIAVARSWGGVDGVAGGGDIIVYVSEDAGRSWMAVSTNDMLANGAHLYVLADGRLVVMGSADHNARSLVASAGSNWTSLARVAVEFPDPGSTVDPKARFSVNSAGVASIASLGTPCDGADPCAGYTRDETEAARLDTFEFSTDLASWTPVPIPYP